MYATIIVVPNIINLLKVTCYCVVTRPKNDHLGFNEKIGFA